MSTDVDHAPPGLEATAGSLDEAAPPGGIGVPIEHAALAASAPSPFGRIWGQGLLVHLVVLGALLIGIAVLVGGPGAFATDEGSYELQLRALQQGSWVWRSGTESLDPSGSHYPIAFSQQTDHGFVPLAKHPAWPLAAKLVSPITGIDHAYAVLGMAGVAVAAAMAWLLAAEHDPRWSRIAFWIAGLSPVVVTASLGWAHAPATGAAGVATLGAVRLARRGLRAGPVALLVVGTTVGLLLRTEAVLVAGALAVGLLVALRAAGKGWTLARAVAGAELVLVAIVTKAEGVWVHHIDGSGSSNFVARTAEAQSAGFVHDRLHAAWLSGLDPGFGGLRNITLVVLAVVAILALLVTLGRSVLVEAWQAGAGVLVLVLLLAMAMAPTEVVSGIVPAWPLAVVGIGAAGWTVLRRLPVELVWVTLYVGAILATQYVDGGAVQWGGRFYAPLIVPVAVLAAGGIVALRRTAVAPAAAGILAALLLVPTFAGVTAVRSANSSSHEVFEQVHADMRPGEVAVTAHQHLPRMMWRYTDLRWLVAADHGSDMAHLLRSLGSAKGPHAVALVVRGRDDALAKAALRQNPEWDEAGRDEVAGMHVVHLRRS